MLDNVKSPGGLVPFRTEQARPELAVNAEDPVLGQPVEQEVQIDQDALKERTDELSLGTTSKTINIQRGVRVDEALNELRSAAQDLEEDIAERIKNKKEIITPKDSIVAKPSIQPTLEVIKQKLEDVVGQDSSVSRNVLGRNDSFFSETLPTLPEEGSLDEDDVVNEALEQVQQFIANVNDEIIANRTTVVNTGANQEAAVGANGTVIQPVEIQPLTGEEQAQEARTEAVQQVQEQADIAIEAQANLSAGTVLDLYNS